MKIWERYLFRRLILLFLSLLFCLFAVYVVVDMSVNGVRFLSHEKTGWIDIALYYARSFARHLDLFLSLALLLSTLKVLFSLNLHSELVAFQAGGLSKKQLLRPFFLSATLLSLISYANSQWLAPTAQDAADAFRSAHEKKRTERDRVYNVALSDHSELIYQTLLESPDGKKELFDVFWVKPGKDLWHMKFLNITPHNHQHEARYVDHFVRSDSGQWEKKESFATRPFPSIRWDSNTPLERFVPFENRSLSTLLMQASGASAEKQTVRAYLHYKIALPLSPFFVIFCIAPVALYFSRTRSPFLVTAIALFAFIGMMTLLDGMLILAENQVLPGALAIWTPPLLLSLFFLRPFAKL